MYKRNPKKWYKHLDFILFDLLCIELSFVLAFYFRFARGLGINGLYNLIIDEIHYSKFMLYMVVVHTALVVFIEPYSGIIYRNFVDECKKVIIYNIFLLVSMVMLMFMEHSSILYSRIVIFLFPIINVCIMQFGRFFIKKIVRSRINRLENQNCLLLIGTKDKVDMVIDNFNERKVNTSRIVGIIFTEEAEGEHYKEIPVVGTVDNMYEYARTNVIDEVLVCTDDVEIKQISDTFTSMGITTHISVDSLIHIPCATMNFVNNIPVITASIRTVTPRQMMMKRIIDIFFGLIGSIITILVTIVVAPLILIADPGPIFFRQERVGRNGRTFKIWKFRTMYKDAEARKAELETQNEMNGLMFKMEDDPRIIGYGKKLNLGKILRKMSIDELPQFFNILEGSMSLVGTRPPTVAEYEKYELHHKGRLAIKPGLTGMWQVSGRNKITDFEEVVRLDKKYIDNFSLRLDLEIILKTIKVVITRDGSM